MKYMIIGGDHPRHLYYLNTIVKNCNVVGAILENREDVIPKPDSNLNSQDKSNFIKHFRNRKKYEDKYFGVKRTVPDCPILNVTENSLSSQESIDFMKKLNPDAVFIFGSGMIREPLFSFLPKISINLHLGLSPRYRGSATLFWPFYFLEPNWAGSTFHLITNEPDAGDIIHQSIPTLEEGDSIHEVACKVVAQSAEDVKLIIDFLESEEELKLHKQSGTGKNFLTRDFIPQHLRVIYDLYNDDIVDHFLSNKINPLPPKIITLT